MNFPIHMIDLDSFVAELRRDGFDARADMFNGQLGLIVGPGGLDPSRLPASAAALYFPLWELNYIPNRELVEARRFHQIVESRPSGWEISRPYEDQPQHARINMRHWNRRASLLGDGGLEDHIQQELARRFPPNTFPVNIDAIGGQMQTYVTVQVTNREAGIDKSKRAIPEDFLGKGGTVAAVLDAAEAIVKELQSAGQISAVSICSTTYSGLKLSLRPIGHVGQGPDMTKWTEVYQYVVESLPPGEQAWIANFGTPYRPNWKILRATGNVQGDWIGNHPSAEEALAALEADLRGGAV